MAMRSRSVAQTGEKQVRKLLGYPLEGKLSFYQGIRYRTLEQAMDHGATFLTPEQAQRFARREVAMAFVHITMILAVLGFGLFIGTDSGRREGIATMGEVCRLIVMRGG